MAITADSTGRVEHAIAAFKAATWNETFESILETLSTPELTLLHERLNAESPQQGIS